MYNYFMINKTNDLRKVSSEKLFKIKNEAMRLRDNGISNKEVAQKFNIDPSVLSRWYSKYIKNDKQPVKVQKKGRKQGTKKSLTLHQEKIIRKKLQEYTGLLDKKIVIKIIKKKYSIIIPNSTIGYYLRGWGIDFKLIKKFENEFINELGIDKFQSTKKEIIKRDGIIIWINIMDYEFETGINLYSISTYTAKNKLIFKFYSKQVQPIELIEFINQIAISFKKHLYTIFSAKTINFIDNSYRFKNSEKITFIHDS